MNIGIVGGGSIGLLVSSYLSQKHAVTVYVRRNVQKEMINMYGTQIKGMTIKGNVQALLMDEMKQEDIYIICVKQPHMKQVMRKMNAVTTHQPVVLLQNGMGHTELTHQAAYPVYVGTVEHGALRLNDYTVQHTGDGRINIASYSGTNSGLSQLANVIMSTDFPISVVTDWEVLLKGKLIINAVINPLTALFNVRNGEIIANPHIEVLAYALCKETAFVLELDHTIAWQKVIDVATKTSENISSMLNDIKQQQKTEIEAITGYILHKSKHTTPLSIFVYHSIKALE